MKKLHLLLLALPLLSTAQDKLVQVPTPCFAGRAFTIKIPVRFPDTMAVQYAWYRNDTLIAGTEKMLLQGEKAISYTVPANKAHGEAVVFHFKYLLHDDFHEWTRSPRYVVSWYEDVGCKATGGAIVGGTLNLCSGNIGGAIQGENVQLCNANVGGEIRGAAVQLCNANAGGEIRGAPAQLCNANAGGEIRGLAVQLCGAGTGGRIGKK